MSKHCKPSKPPIQGTVFKPYQAPAAAPVRAQKSAVNADPAPSASISLSPELRAWLTLQMRTLAYWVNLPDEQVPTLSAANRKRDVLVLAGLKHLLE